MVDEFLEFCGAVMKHGWWFWGGVASLLLDAIQRCRNAWIPRWIFWGAAIITFTAAFFLAWQEKRQEAIGLHNTNIQLEEKLKGTREQLAALSEPSMHGTIEEVVTGDDVDIGAAAIFVLMAVRNTGAQSIVEGFRLSIKSDTLTFNNISPLLFPKGLNLKDNESAKDKLMELDASTAMYEKSVNPIPRGDLMRGWLLYSLKGINADQIRKVGTKFTVVFKDVFGKAYESSPYAMTGKSGIARYYPGGGRNFIFPPDQKKQKYGVRPKNRALDEKR